MFQSLGPAMVIPNTQLEEVSELGQGRFATVCKMRWHHQDGHRVGRLCDGHMIIGWAGHVMVT